MKRIQLTQGQFTIVDDKNYEWLSQWKWFAQWREDRQTFYTIRNSNHNKVGKKYPIYMAREILGLKYGDKRQADHKNHKTLDNRESNLRIATNQQNHFNRKNPKGYYWNKARGKHQAYITSNGKNIHLGMFDTAEEAHNAYLKAKKLYHRI